MARIPTASCALMLIMVLSACSVGPGTPLIDALRAEGRSSNGNVPAPKGYGPPGATVESTGLVNPEERKETAEYLESLAQQ